MNAFVAVGRALRALYDDLFAYVWLSLLWWLSLVLVLPAGPATLALQRVANRSANYKRVDTSDFFKTMRQHIWPGWLLFGGNLLALIGVVVNIFFYLNRPGWSLVAAVVWAWVLLILLFMGQFLFPLFWQQDDRQPLLVVRNALILSFRRPLFSLLLLLLQLILLTISVVIPIFLVLTTPAMIALIGNFGMAYLLQEMGMAPLPPVVDSKQPSTKRR
ncbi:MAG: hypothetical protein KBG20_12340 [Caldilineaceae bacterium]|nr:hypothetical protein [Caldilineaceae bacterium]MBP8109462.1 hypothetical protein [Caldilineaceae bacterium]MBP8123648.1 hypothetical protein [Caldilineaceae bacterium]MBP9073088.1 hypothetical protein [Caldilineaceae bacterium]